MPAAPSTPYHRCGVCGCNGPGTADAHRENQRKAGLIRDAHDRLNEVMEPGPF